MANDLHLVEGAARHDVQSASQLFILHVHQELQRARAKFPGNAVQLAALHEESGELAKALLENRIGKASSSDVYWEAVQVAAMACRVAIEGDSSFPYVPYWKAEA